MKPSEAIENVIRGQLAMQRLSISEWGHQNGLHARQSAKAKIASAGKNTDALFGVCKSLGLTVSDVVRRAEELLTTIGETNDAVDNRVD